MPFSILSRLISDLTRIHTSLLEFLVLLLLLDSSILLFSRYVVTHISPLENGVCFLCLLYIIFKCLDLIFKVRSLQYFEMSNFNQNRTSACYLLNQTMYSGQSLYIVYLWHNKELIRFLVTLP